MALVVKGKFSLEISLYTSILGWLGNGGMMKTILVLSVLIFSGCASGIQNLRKIDPGMSGNTVQSIMGRRDSFASVESNGSTYTLHKYTNRLCNGHASLTEKCDFYVIYRDGEVIETGVSDVRSTPANLQFLYLFRVN